MCEPEQKKQKKNLVCELHPPVLWIAYEHIHQFAFLGHILELPDDELVKVNALYELTRGQRRPRRQYMPDCSKVFI